MININNMFAKCKTLEELYNVFAYNSDFSFGLATSEELERLADVFAANVAPADMVDTPLGEKEFNHIRDFVISKFSNVDATVNPEENENMEEDEMGNNTENLINDVINDINDAMDSFDDNTGHGCKKEKTVEEADNCINKMNAALANVLNFIGDTLGFNQVRNSIAAIIEAGLDGKSTPTDIKNMAKKCEEKIKEEAEFLMEFAADDVTFGKAIQLKALAEGGRRKSVFESFACGILNIAEGMFGKLKEWFDGFNDKKGVLAAIFRGIAGFAGLLKKGLKIVVTGVTKVVSFIVAGVIIAVSAIVNVIKSFVSKLNNWNKIKEEDDETEEDALEDDFDEE